METSTLTGLTYDELKVGEWYDIYCSQFDVVNRCKLISFDTTHLKRRISYWQFEHDYKERPFNREKLIISFMKDFLPPVFALWDFEIKEDRNVITPSTK